MIAPLTTLVDLLRGTLNALWREVVKFGIIGAMAFVIDVGTMNLLRHTLLTDKPTTAKIISASLATVFAWIGNRQWTFRHRRGRGATSEFSLFVLTNGVALLIGVGAIALSHYGLRLTTLVADNIANVIGIGLGTLFRFWAYRRFVFADASAPSADPEVESDAAGLAPSGSGRP